MGFYTTRIVQAKTMHDAKENAVAELLKENQVQNLISATQASSSKVPVIEIDDIEPVSWLYKRFQKHSGFTFYAIEERIT